MRIKKLERLNVKLIIIILFSYNAELQKKRQLNFKIKILNK